MAGLARSHTMIRQSYDLDADALYIKVTGGKAARTVEIDTGTLVDLDAAGAVVGIEVISPQRSWPVEEILARFKMSTEDVAQLRAYFAGPAGTAQLKPPAHPATRVPVAV
jgi:uncharacterized protein YuzE